MELLSHKEAKVISEKYLYKWNEELETYSDYNEHKNKMIDDGFTKTNSRHESNGMIVTYVKYTNL